MTLGRQMAVNCSCTLGALASWEQCSFGAGRCLLSSMCPPAQGKEDVPLPACLQA